MPLDLTGLGPQVAVDLADGLGELLGVGLEQLADPGEGYAGLGQRLDPNQVDDVLDAVPAVARCVSVRLRQQAALVVVPHGADCHPGEPGELADREHRH